MCQIFMFGHLIDQKCSKRSTSGSFFRSPCIENHDSVGEKHKIIELKLSIKKYPNSVPVQFRSVPVNGIIIRFRSVPFRFQKAIPGGS